jgi:hypothetical protein
MQYHVEVGNVEVLVTHDWQKALDSWSNSCWEGNSKKIVVKMRNKERILRDLLDTQNWSKFLIENSSYNRVEKRIMTDIAMTDNETENMNTYARLNFHGKFENMSNDEQDQIINPKHYKMIPPEAYKRFPEGLEYMHLMEYILKHHSGVESHLLGQVFKYACRLGKKDSKLQDAKKIAWYADRLVKVIENDN